MFSTVIFYINSIFCLQVTLFCNCQESLISVFEITATQDTAANCTIASEITAAEDTAAHCTFASVWWITLCITDICFRGYGCTRSRHKYGSGFYVWFGYDDIDTIMRHEAARWITMCNGVITWITDICFRGHGCTRSRQSYGSGFVSGSDMMILTQQSVMRQPTCFIANNERYCWTQHSFLRQCDGSGW